MDPYESMRSEMVDLQLIPRGISDQATLDAMRTVPRHQFVPEKFKELSYQDMPLQIGSGQTISQPYIVALMTEAAMLTGVEKVLEIGTGSGYAAAVLSQIVPEVYTIERIEDLACHAQDVYEKIGYKNIFVKIADGTVGWKQNSPFDVIIVTAASPDFPKSLLEQLKIGGRMVIPVGDIFSQKLYRITKKDENSFDREVLEYVRFVPLIGDEGWKA